MNIDDLISEADDFLTAHPICSDHQGDDRQTTLQLKDMHAHNAYNNSGHHLKEDARAETINN